MFDKKREVSLSDVYDTFEKVKRLIAASGYWLCKFYIKQYRDKEEKRLGRNVDFYSVEYFSLKGVNLFVSFKEEGTYFYPDAKYYENDKIREDIKLFGGQKEKESLKILEEIYPLLYIDYVIEYQKIKSAISIITNDTFKEKYVCYRDKSKSCFSSEYEIKAYKNFLEPKDFYLTDEKNIFSLLENHDDLKVTINHYKKYQELVALVQTYFNEVETLDLFHNDEILDKYKNRTLEEFDLSAIDFDNKNISGLNISKNPEAHINFDKIEKDLTNCNFNGYNLNKVTLRNFNLTDTDLRNTKATVDLATCVVSVEGKLNSGTLFDEENTFVFGYTKIDRETLNKLNIKIYKKCYNRNRK